MFRYLNKRESYRFHPDKNEGSSESVAKFREITEAYETLSNPEKKKVYDENLRTYSQPDYSDFGRSSYVRRSNFRRHSPPYTGRTNEYNYDEHFKRHYEDYYRQREAEQEYFRRRWEGEFHRRYPDYNTYYRQGFGSKEKYEEPATKPRRRSYSYPLFMLALWAPLLFIQLVVEFFKNDRPKTKSGPLYYKVDTQNETPIKNK